MPAARASPAIRVVGDVTRAGYNLVNGRSVTDTSSIAPASCASLSCQTWTSPQQATNRRRGFSGTGTARVIPAPRPRPCLASG